MAINGEYNKLEGTVKSAGRDISRDMKDLAGTAEHKAEKFAQEAGSKIGDFAAKVRDNAADYTERTSAYVKENPTRSLVMASAVGVVAGALLVGLFSRRKSY